MPSFGKHPDVPILLSKIHQRSDVFFFKNIWCRIWRAINRINISHMTLEAKLLWYLLRRFEAGVILFPRMTINVFLGWKKRFLGWKWCNSHHKMGKSMVFYNTLATWSWFCLFFGTDFVGRDPIRRRFGTSKPWDVAISVAGGMGQSGSLLFIFIIFVMGHTEINFH